ncbi:MAG: nicotinate-nucleotide--dimethylbenzimidazole phosphoribosyltransferase [Gammaproteobacteria bacterium]
MNWLNDPIVLPSQEFYQKALARQAQLTKPAGSLGRLEELAVRLAAMQRMERPDVSRIGVSIFAADHGIAEAGVSAFPQAVTTEMVKNFIQGGAAANVLAKHVDARFEVIDVGLMQALNLPGLVVERAGSGTANFLRQPAMSTEQLDKALNAGRNAVVRALRQPVQLFIGGEMGIGNTTSASALASAVLSLDPAELTGAGTGLEAEAIRHKAHVIRQALDSHRSLLTTPLAILQCLGGFEIAALVGAYLFAGQQGLPVLVDGFISSVAALFAVNIQAGAGDWFIYAHASHERGHRLVLEALKAQPLLDLDMRLGEASGALMAVPVVQLACKLHNEMATFEQAHITTE